MLLEIDTGVKEAQLLHPGQFGYFALFRKPQSGRGRPSQRMYQMAQLEAVVQAMQRQPDAYLSQASFVTRSRRETFLHEIRSVFVDLDCYNLGLEPDEHFLAKVIEQAELVGIPAPSYVVRSGRGMYAKWLFSHPVSASHLPSWKALQASILGVYRRLGADLKVRDSSRVLRIIGSTNSKSPDSTVEAIYNSGELFDFDALCAQVAKVDLSRFGLADEAAIERTLARIKKAVHEGVEVSAEAAIEHLTFYAQTREPILLARHTAQGLNWRRFLDMRDLAQKRGGIHKGSRDMFMFWMMSFLAHSEIVTVENFFDEAKELSRAMSSDGFDPISDGSLRTLAHKVAQRRAGLKVEFRGAKFDPVYTPSNEYLIDVLDITDEEMRSLRTIISTQEKLRRADEKVLGRAERRQARIQWRVQAMAMIAEGTLSQAEIAAKVGVSRTQISRLAAGKLKTPGTVAMVMEKAGLSSDLERLRTRSAAGAGAGQGLCTQPSAIGAATTDQRLVESTEAAAYEEIQRLSRATQAEQEAERQRRRQELEREREALMRQAVSTAQRLLQRVKEGAAGVGAAAPKSASNTEVEKPVCAMAIQEITMTEKTPKKDDAGSRSRELLMKAKQAKASQEAGRASSAVSGREPEPDPVPAQPTASHQNADAMEGSPQLDAGPGQEAVVEAVVETPLAEAADTVDEPRGVPRRSPFAHLVARQEGSAPAPQAPGARHAHSLEHHHDPEASDPGESAGQDAMSGPVVKPAVAGSKLTFEELARRGAARKEQLAQAERALMARGDSNLPADPPWDHPDLPAGSRFSQEEWDQARENGRYHVFEVHVSAQAGLVQIEKAPVPTKRRQVVDGKIVERVVAAPSEGFIDPVTAEILDGCLLIGPKGKTDYPRAATGRLVYKHPELGDWVYRIIRPTAQAQTHAHLATVNAVYWASQPEEKAQDAPRERCK